VNLNLSGRACLVLGTGPELLVRVQNLLDAGAHVSVVSDAAGDAVRALSRTRKVLLEERPFSEADLEGKWLCVLVGAAPELALRVAEASERARVLFCATDGPEKNGFSHMALARAGSLVIAVGTAGEAPALARRLREELQRLLDESDMASFVERLAELRRHTPSADRKQVLGNAVAALNFTGKIELPK
jgi:uroporphyrin-III C-methyltransferase/precorrin-2 dehydrogenase/sirohydrochlorin ferrochelatase